MKDFRWCKEKVNVMGSLTSKMFSEDGDTEPLAEPSLLDAQKDKPVTREHLSYYYTSVCMRKGKKKTKLTILCARYNNRIAKMRQLTTDIE